MAGRCIITIGREYGSGGREIGERLAEKLGFSFYDRNLLTLASLKSGISEDSFSDRDERVGRRYFPYRTPDLGDELFDTQFRIMVEKAKTESCVIVGRCSDMILKDFQNTIHVFIYADTEDKLARIRERNGLDEVQAAKEMRRIEKIRRIYYQYYTDCDWGSRENKDLLLNSSRLGIEGSVELISAYLRIRKML